MGDPVEKALLDSTGSPGSGTSREKASSCCNHPDVLARVDAMDAGNKQKLSEKRLIYYQPDKKKQRDEGWFQALDYFEHSKEERLTWAAVLFYDGKVDLYGSKGDVRRGIFVSS